MAHINGTNSGNMLFGTNNALGATVAQLTGSPDTGGGGDGDTTPPPPPPPTSPPVSDELSRV